MRYFLCKELFKWVWPGFPPYDGDSSVHCALPKHCPLLSCVRSLETRQDKSITCTFEIISPGCVYVSPVLASCCFCWWQRGLHFKRPYFSFALSSMFSQLTQAERARERERIVIYGYLILSDCWFCWCFKVRFSVKDLNGRLLRVGREYFWYIGRTSRFCFLVFFLLLSSAV